MVCNRRTHPDNLLKLRQVGHYSAGHYVKSRPKPMSNQPRVVKVLAALLISMTAGAVVLMALGMFWGAEKLETVFAPNTDGGKTE